MVIEIGWPVGDSLVGAWVGCCDCPVGDGKAVATTAVALADVVGEAAIGLCAALPDSTCWQADKEVTPKIRIAIIRESRRYLRIYSDISDSSGHRSCVLAIIAQTMLVP